MAAKTKSHINNQRGNAMVETLPILVIFVVLLSFGLGFFGFVHTAIMNSMAARNYAYETFKNRSDTTFFRDRKAEEIHYTHYKFVGNRFHTIDSEKRVGSNLDVGQYATTRDIAFGRRIPASAASEVDHNVRIYNISGRNRRGGVEASPAWVMVGYGLCIDASCGDR